MSAEKMKLSYDDERELLLQRSLENQTVDERNASEIAKADTKEVMNRYRDELRDSISKLSQNA